MIKTLLLAGLKSVMYGAYLIFVSTFLFFSMLEIAPGLTTYMNLQPIRYYAQWQEYRPDDTLVFLPTKAQEGKPTSLETEFVGDLFSPAFGVTNPGVKYHATYTSDGFRTNSSSSDFKVLVVGDSYVEIGEDDALTLSEQLKQTSGLSTFNLGRAWYGPFQYLELLKRYGATMRPRFAVLCFFDGNDAEDTRQYLRWQRGKSYYSFVLSTKSYMGRYFTALRDSYSYLLKQIAVQLGSIVSHVGVSSGSNTNGTADVSAPGEPSAVHSDLGFIGIGAQSWLMRFSYWNQLTPTEELLKAEEWKAIGQVLKDYEHLAAQYGIEPIVVFIPTKIEVYGTQYLESSNTDFLQRIKRQIEFENNSHDALVHLIKDTRLRFVDLLPEFRKQAREGKLLYYPFDTHWNVEGRRLAAKLIADSLAE